MLWTGTAGAGAGATGAVGATCTETGGEAGAVSGATLADGVESVGGAAGAGCACALGESAANEPNEASSAVEKAKVRAFLPRVMGRAEQSMRQGTSEEKLRHEACFC